jgi:subtilisin family serine protease
VALNPFAVHQFHLEPAPVGVDARFAHGRGGVGTDVRLADVEAGWFLSHQDLPMATTLPSQQFEMVEPSMHHGTAVIGIAAAVDNDVGVIGIAPKPREVLVSSHVRNQQPGFVAEAIEDAAARLDPGDVLLIEWQLNVPPLFNLPVDADPRIRGAVKRLCDRGIVVIEPAGNGNVDLDPIPDLDPLAPAFDSGAIIVGGCHSALDVTRSAHERWTHAIHEAGSNFGSRVDCHAFAEDVVTAGPPRFPGLAVGTGTTPESQYRRDFGGTSAAAAIVAGVVLCLQSLHVSRHRRPMAPRDVRDALRTQGTPQGGRVPGHIGLMPDLRKLVAHIGV